MNVTYKEDPREWRKITLLSIVPLILIITLLCWWKHSISQSTWMVILITLALVMVTACVHPRWFRSYYRASSIFGFWLSQTVGKIALMIFFLLVMTPLGLALRLFGKDTLRLKHPHDAKTYWIKAKPGGPLDRMF